MDSPLGGGYDFSAPLHPKRDLSKLSPYLNFDAGYVPPSRPEFIFLDETARTRGRMELAFSQVCLLFLTDT